jgi:hypothetical protein
VRGWAVGVWEGRMSGGVGGLGVEGDAARFHTWERRDIVFSRVHCEWGSLWLA